MEKSLIQLSERQVVFRKELEGYIDTIESVVSEKIDHENAEIISEEITRRMSLCGNNPRIMELAKGIHSAARGQVAGLIMSDPKALNAKADIQRLYIAGLMAPYDALYERAEKSCKILEQSIEGMRTILSYRRELIKREM